MGADSDEDNTSDREYGTLDEDGFEKLPMDDAGKHDGLQLMNLLYAIAEDQAGKGTVSKALWVMYAMFRQRRKYVGC